MYKFCKFKGLHLGKVSLANTLRQTWHKAKFWMRSTFKDKLNATIDEVATLLEKDGSVDFIRAINGPFTGQYRNINFNHYVKDFQPLTLQYVFFL